VAKIAVDIAASVDRGTARDFDRYANTALLASDEHKSMLEAFKSRKRGLKMADLAGVAQQSASVALGVVAQTGIVPLSGALQIGVDAAQGVGRNGSWTRVWRRLFHRHEYFLAQTNSQAIALTNALPQVQQLWEMPKIGGYLDRFASATQRVGHVLRDLRGLRSRVAGFEQGHAHLHQIRQWGQQIRQRGQAARLSRSRTPRRRRWR
jgi:hypothetical protein